MSSKKVIFVGGTAYSGSTFFDMTLGNDPAGFSIGEVYALFNPYRAHHIDPECGCGDPQCDLWPQVKAGGEAHLYETIFRLRPEAEFIVDSSKDPFWISRQTQRLQTQSIETRHIVIWKSPLELAHSYKKRGQQSAWERSWVNYFRLFYTLEDEWRSVPYADYSQDPELLATICQVLGIPYFREKKAFWNKTHHLLFGNASARVHLGEDVSSARNGRPLTQSGSTEDELRTVYYRPVQDRELQQEVARRTEESAYINGLVDLLRRRDVRQTTSQDEGDLQYLLMGTADIGLRRLKKSLTYGLGNLRYGSSNRN